MRIETGKDGVIHVYEGFRELATGYNYRQIYSMLSSNYAARLRRHIMNQPHDYLSDDEREWVAQGCPDE